MPHLDDGFTIIDNRGGNSVNGTFAGLPEWTPGGPLVFVGSIGFGVSYVGGDGNDVELTVRVVNGPPVADAGGPYSIVEGQSLTLDGSGSHDPDAGDTLSYSWTINGHANAASGVSPTLSWSQLQTLGIDDGLAAFSIAVSVDDGEGHVVESAAATLTLGNATPLGVIDGPADGVRGQTRTFTFAANDASSTDQASGFSYTIDWGDGSPVETVPATTGNGDGVTVDHVFITSGAYTVSVTAADKDGGRQPGRDTNRDHHGRWPAGRFV